MCLAVPAQIIELLENEQALVESGGVRKVISVSMIEAPKVDDFVIVHVGHALNKIDASEAQKTIDLIKELNLEI